MRIEVLPADLDEVTVVLSAQLRPSATIGPAIVIRLTKILLYLDQV